jgi:hypothetical protein
MNETSLDQRDREVRSGQPSNIRKRLRSTGRGAAGLGRLGVAEFSRALAGAISMERNFYDHNHNRIRIARPLGSGDSGVLLAHRKLFELATASAHEPKHQHRNHNRGNGGTTNAGLRRLRTFQAANALKPRGRDRALHGASTAAELAGDLDLTEALAA